MNALTSILIKFGLLKDDLDYHLLRASMVIIFLAFGSCATFVSTVTIIPFMPNGWDPAAGFPAMAGNVPFLVKDVVLLAVSIYLLKQDVMRVCVQSGARKQV